MLNWPGRDGLFRPAHVSHEDLLLFLDGELKPWKADRVRRHLESCWTCRVERQKIEQAISGYVQALEAAEAKGEAPRGWREFETRLDHFDRDMAAAPLGLRLPWRYALAGLVIFASMAAVGWFVAEKKDTTIKEEPRLIPEAVKRARPAGAPEQVVVPPPPVPTPTRQEMVAKAIEIEYAIHRVRACLGGELRVAIAADGLRITGEPESTEREREIRHALSAVLMPVWVRRSAGKPRRASGSTTQMLVTDSGSAPAEEAVRSYLQAHSEPGSLEPAAGAADYSSRVLSEASAAVREAWALRRLNAYESLETSNRWRGLIEEMQRDHLRALGEDVNRAADLIVPVFALSKTPAALSKTPAPQVPGSVSRSEETERLFQQVDEFEHLASALFGHTASPGVPRDQASALIAIAGQILRRAEHLDRLLAPATTAHTPSESMRH